MQATTAINGLPEAARKAAEKARTEKRREAFSKLLKLKNTDASELARMADVPRTTIYSFLQEKSASFRGTTEVKLAAALGVSVADLYGGDGEHSHINAIPVVGELSDTGAVRMFKEALYEVQAPALLDMRGHRAFQVGSLYMPPAGRDWLVIVRAMPSKLLLGEPALVFLNDRRVFFRRLARGSTSDVFNLETWTGLPPLCDVRIAEAFRFVCLTPPLKPLKLGDED
jgi:hypothetical protein